MPKTPLEIAMSKKEKTKKCVSCESRTEINGVSYCGVSGKILHPYLLAPPYSECQIKRKDGDSDG